ncbi:MAG: hypothetical protein JWM11_1152 [Planctomycetaceae bacterium]|nr:hypothetical protein [Planctomycetaceae bacterium]
MRQFVKQWKQQLALVGVLTLGGCGLATLPPVSVTIKPAEDQGTAEAVATTETKTPAETSTTTAPMATVAPGGAGQFIGTVTLTDAAPSLAPLVAQGAMVQDATTCSAVAVPNEALIVDSSSKGIQNVFIYLEKAPAGAPKIPLPEKQIFDQKGCRFVPHAMLVRTSVPLLVMSEDDVGHNTHTFPKRNTGFNSGIGKKERKGVPINYTQSEKEPIEVVCDIHKWMKGYHLPLDHGYAALTNEKGEFSIKGLPAGTYTFKVWHEAGGLLERSLKVVIKGGDAPVKLEYAASKFKQ